MTKRSLDDFTKAHDPLYVDASPVPVFGWEPSRRERFIFTAAQNATPVDPVWWAILKSMAKAKGAELRVFPLRYKNPTSRWTGSQDGREWWAKEVRPHLFNTRVQLNQNLVLLGDMKIQPTAADPVGAGDLAAVSRDCSAIVGHPKIQTRSVPTPQNRMAKLLMTSGMCTEENYSDTRAGRVAAFHHSLSAVIVELDGKRFYMRRVHFDRKTASATDSLLGVRYTARGAEIAPRAHAVSLGDLHCDFADPAVIEATFGTGGIIQRARPRVIVYHDIDDGYSANPHHKGNPFNKIAKYRGSLDNVRAELDRTVKFLRDHLFPDTLNLIVGSNHHDFIGRWINATDWRDDPVNAEFYLETALMMVRGTKLGPSGTTYPDPFKFWIDNAKLPLTRVLNEDESFVRADVELAMHGHRGPNGARGSIRNLRRIGVKSIIQHAHTPGEDEGATQGGTSTRLRLEYNKGPSSWLNAHVILGDDGKRQLVVIVDGKCHT